MNKGFQLEAIHELNRHAERLLAALYSVLKEFESEEFQFMNSPEAAKFLKGSSKDPKFLAFMTSERVEQWGRLLRHPYAVLQHLRCWQMEAHKGLFDAQSQSGDLDITWNYVFGFPLMQLFTNYVKLHLFLIQLPKAQLSVQLYRRCLAFFGKQDQNLDGLLNFLKSRETLKPVEAELQGLQDHLSSGFKAILPAMQMALGAAPTFPWRMLSLVEKPRPLLPSDIFFREEYLVLIHLTEICECFVLFGILFMQFLVSDPFFMDAFVLVYSYCLVLHLYGSLNIDIKQLFTQVKKFKDKRLEIDMQFLDAGEAGWGRQKSSQGYCRRKLTTLIKDFIAACKVDASIPCTKHPIALSLLGFASFELQLAFALKTSKPALEPWPVGDISELMFWFVKLVSIMTQMIPDLRRFFLFNLREFDCNYLDTLAHSYVIPQTVYKKIATLVSALRTLNIEDFDNGEDLDLYPCLSIAGSICSAFNKFGESKGITHLSQLLQLVSGCSFRLTMFQDPFGLILNISMVHKFWQYLDHLTAIANDFNDPNAKYNVFVLHMCHFYGMDEAAVAEIPFLRTQIKNSYDNGGRLMVNTIFSWFKGLQDQCFSDFRQQMSATTAIHATDVAGKESQLNARKKLKPADVLLQKITYTLAALQDLGVIYVLGEEHNVFAELSAKIETIMSTLFFKEETSPPMELTKKIQTARWALQQICSAANFPFHHTVHKNLLALSSGSDGDDKLGPIAQGYRKMYVQLAKEALKSAYFSNNQEMFVPASGSQSGHSTVYHYMSLPALHALHELIGTTGCYAITKALAALAGHLTKPLASTLAQVLKNRSSFEDGFCQFADSEKIIRELGHVSAVLRLRDMLRPFSGGTENIPTQPEFDVDVINAMKDAGIVDVITDVTVTKVLGALLSAPYWEKFDYDVAHDAITDNSHLWARTFDAWIGTAIHEDKGKQVEFFYDQLFLDALSAIAKGREVYSAKIKAGKWPGMNLIILVDHLVTVSRYADYSQLERRVAYQYIRSLYTAKLSQWNRK